MLFDTASDPDEFFDLGECAKHADTIEGIHDCLAQWDRRMSQRVTMPDAEIAALAAGSGRRSVSLGLHDGC